ncbi:MAG: O-antigen ligase family protein [Planctomycetota bacterium]|nr:O-antigen ligase family protein [Planctomycetota bacterium]
MPVPQRPNNLKNNANLNDNLWQQRLTTAVDLGIASTVLVAPLFMGGRGPVGRFVFVLCVAVTAMLWCARQCVSERAAWRRSGAEILLLAGLGLLILQLIPLPHAVLSLLSPQVSELLPLWTPHSDIAFQLGTWNQVSLHPMATQSGLATYIAYAMLFLVTLQRLAEMQDVQRLLRLIAVATCVMAILGLAQFLFGNGKFLWVFEHVSRDTSKVVKGPFQNQNHFAHLLALGIGPLLWWLSIKGSDPICRNGRKRASHKRGPTPFSTQLQNPAVQSQILWIALGTVTFAALLTFSRGGVIATLLAAITGVAFLSWKQMFSRRALAVVSVIACLMVVSLSIHGYEPLARRLATLNGSQPIEEFAHGRWELWNAHLKAIPDFWLLGSGVGTHRDIYPTYLEEHFDVEFTHGESGYLPLVLETGLLGSSLLLVGMYFSFRWALFPFLRSTDRATVACAAAIVPGLIVSVVHSLGDFVWYIPACMTTTVLLLAAACYLFHSTATPGSSETASETGLDSRSHRLIYAPRLAWIGTSVACLVTFALATSTLLGPATAAPRWYEYQRLANSTGAANWQPTTPEDLAALATSVEATVHANPSDARAQAQLAGLYLQQFDVAQQHAQNPMPLTQIRDAALASEFSSKQQLDQWLDVAVGENRRFFDAALDHALRSVRLCPLQGEAYALLARLTFLEGPDADRKRLYVQQALRVRPYHSRVQFVAGQDALLAGNVEEAFSHWKKAFHGEREVQDELVRELTGVVPANDLLEALAPDRRGLEALLSHYKRVGEAESAKVVATYYTHYLAEQFRSDPAIDKPGTLKRLSSLHEYLDSPDEAIRLAQEAAILAPADFDVKLRIGRLLVTAGRFKEAQVELQWCARRRPDHAEIRKLLTAANRGSLLRQADASTAPTVPQPLRQ